MQKITPNLWFDRNAEEAMNFYVSLFSRIAPDDSKIVSIQRYPDEVPADFMKGMEGKVLTGIFELAGYRFMALDGGQHFPLTPAISFFIHCRSVAEIDMLWAGLSDGATVLMPLDEYPFSPKYGWLKDRYGVSWQLILGEEVGNQQWIMPCLLFVGDQAGKAEVAMQFYADAFGNSRVGDISRYGADQQPDQEGTVAYGELKLEGQLFAFMDSAHQHDYTFSEALSLYVECETQAEVDHLWERLSAVPSAEQCGWLKDQFGVSWQIIPKRMGELLSDPDPEKSGRVMQAMLQMKKIDIAQLESAYMQGG